MNRRENAPDALYQLGCTISGLREQAGSNRRPSIHAKHVLLTSQTLPPAELCSQHRKRAIRTPPPGPKPCVLATAAKLTFYTHVLGCIWGGQDVENTSFACAAVSFSPAAYKAAALTAELPPQDPEAIFVSSPLFPSILKTAIR